MIGSVFEASKDAAGFLTFWVAFVGAGIGVGFLFGRGKLGNVFIDVYIALAISRTLLAFPTLSGLPFAGVTLFLVVLVFLIGIDQHLFDLHISNAAYDIFWRVLVMGILVTGMTLSALASLLPAQVTGKAFLVPVTTFFGSPLSVVLWLVAPLFVLVFMNRRLGG